MTLITRLINSNPTEATILNRVDCEKFIFQKYQIYICISFLPHRNSPHSNIYQNSYMLTYMAIFTNFTFPSYDNAVWMRKDKSPHNGTSSNIRCISPLDKISTDTSYFNSLIIIEYLQSSINQQSIHKSFDIKDDMIGP